MVVLSLQAEREYRVYRVGLPLGWGFWKEDSPFVPLSCLGEGYHLLWSCCVYILDILI